MEENMRKQIPIILALLLLTSCAGLTNLLGSGEEYSYEKGLTADNTDNYALILVQRELSIEYLDDVKTRFLTGKVYVKPGDRKISFKYGNSYQFTECIDMDVYLMAGGTYVFGFKESPDGKLSFSFEEKRD
jgi:hypothetical protein